MTLCLGKTAVLLVTEYGDMYASGANANGELGLGHNNTVRRPTLLDRNLVFGGNDVVMAAVGMNHAACVTSDGDLWTWGSVQCGQLGIRDDPMECEWNDGRRMTPYLVPRQTFNQSPALMVACGEDFTLLLTVSGQVWSCGRAQSGQLGHDDDLQRNVLSLINPVHFGGGAHIGMIAAGVSHSMAVSRTGGTLWTWGENECGQLGQGGVDRSFKPVVIPATTFNGVGVVSVDGGFDTTMVVTEDGALWGCGSLAYGELGIAEFEHAALTSCSTLQQVVGPDFADGHGVRMAACGDTNSIVLAKNNTVWVCGCAVNLRGNTPEYDISWILVPVNHTQFRGSKVVLVDAGGSTFAAVNEDGEVFEWGNHSMVSDLMKQRIRRWHNLPQEHALAVAMGMHSRLGSDSVYSREVFPADLFHSMMSNMHLVPRASTSPGLLDRLGRKPSTLPHHGQQQQDGFNAEEEE